MTMSDRGERTIMTPLRSTIQPLIVGTACGVGVQGLFYVLHGTSFNVDFVMSLIVFSISSIVAALACVYPVFLVLPRLRVPAVWLGTVWGAAIAMLVAGVLFTWEGEFLAMMGASGAAAGLGYSLWARRLGWRNNLSGVA